MDNSGLFVCFMVFNTTFNNISVYRGGQFYWWRKPEYPEKTTDIMLYHQSGIRTRSVSGDRYWLHR